MCIDESLQLRRMRFKCEDSWPALSPWLQCTSSMLMVCCAFVIARLITLIKSAIFHVRPSCVSRVIAHCHCYPLHWRQYILYCFCASWLQQTIARAARWCSTCNVLDCMTAFHGMGNTDTEQQADATQSKHYKGLGKHKQAAVCDVPGKTCQYIQKLGLQATIVLSLLCVRNKHQDHRAAPTMAGCSPRCHQHGQVNTQGLDIMFARAGKGWHARLRVPPCQTEAAVAAKGIKWATGSVEVVPQ